MGQSRTAILYGLLPNDAAGLPDEATDELAPTSDGNDSATNCACWAFERFHERA